MTNGCYHSLMVMQFTRRAEPVAGSSNQLRARTASGSCQISTRIGDQGLECAIQNIFGPRRRVESEVMITGENSFVESGHFRFGEHVCASVQSGRAISLPARIRNCAMEPSPGEW